MYIRDNSFMISCAARSGSTYLVHLIRSHPDLFFHGEVFGGEKVGGLLGEYGKKVRELPEVTDMLTNVRNNNPELFLYKYVLDTQGYKGIGFKYKTDEAISDDYKHITDLITQDKDIKIIFLLRKNLLAQYLSHQVVLKQTGVTLALKDEDIPEINKIKIHPNKCAAYIKNVINRQKKAEAIFSENRSYHVAYEDIVNESPYKEKVLAEMQRFLGVKVESLSSPTKKIIKEPIENVIHNYNEVCEELKRDGFEKYIS